MKNKTIQRLIFQIFLLATITSYSLASSPASARTDSVVSTGEFSLQFCYVVEADCSIERPTWFKDAKDSKYFKSIAYLAKAFPGATWDGKQWSSNPTTKLETYMLIKSFVIWSEIPLVDSAESKKIMESYNLNLSESGYPSDSDIYIATALKNGFPVNKISANKELSSNESKSLLTVLKRKMNIENEIIPAQDSTLISNVDTNKNQEYYQDGPIVNYFNVKGVVSEKDKLHQFSSIKGSTFTESKTVGYAIGIWGDAQATVSGSKLVGGFFTVQGMGEGANSQLVGQEIDVINNLPAGTISDKSSVGQQIVTIGTNDSTTATEIISDGVSRWKNGITFTDNSMSEDATIIGLSQKSTVKYGLDFGNTPFSQAAIRISPDSTIKLESVDYTHAASIKLTKDNYLQFASGTEGFVLKSNDLSTNLLRVTKDGNLVLKDSYLYVETVDGKLKKVDLAATNVQDTAQNSITWPILISLVAISISFYSLRLNSKNKFS